MLRPGSSLPLRRRTAIRAPNGARQNPGRNLIPRTLTHHSRLGCSIAMLAIAVPLPDQRSGYPPENAEHRRCQHRRRHDDDAQYHKRMVSKRLAQPFDVCRSQPCPYSRQQYMHDQQINDPTGCRACHDGEHQPALHVGRQRPTPFRAVSDREAPQQ